MASATSDTGNTSSKQQQAQRKENYNKSKRPVSSVDHFHPYRRKKEKRSSLLNLHMLQSTCFGTKIVCVCMCVCVCMRHVCVCVCVCVRKENSSSRRHELESSLFLSTGNHPAVVQLPKKYCSARPGQSSDRPNPPSNKTLFRLFSSFHQSSEKAL